MKDRYFITTLVLFVLVMLIGGCTFLNNQYDPRLAASRTPKRHIKQYGGVGLETRVVVGLTERERNDYKNRMNRWENGHGPANMRRLED